MARYFNGTNYITFPSAIITAAPLTISAWFWDTGANSARIIAGVGSGSGGNANDFCLYYESPTTLIKAITQAGGSNGIAITTTSPRQGRWNHGCAVFAAANDRRVFVNGTGKGTNTTSLTPNPASMTRTRIGARGQDTAIQFYIGGIAEVAYWNVALTDVEVAVLSKGLPAYKIRPNNIVAYLPLNNSEDTDVVKGRKFIQTASPGFMGNPPIVMDEAINPEWFVSLGVSGPVFGPKTQVVIY